MEILEHPDITHALLTGYPKPIRPGVECTGCGCVLFGDDKIFFLDGEELCDSCFMSQLEEYKSAEEIAEALNYKVKTAEAVLEGE